MIETVSVLAMIVFALWLIVKLMPWILIALGVLLVIGLILEFTEGRKSG